MDKEVIEKISKYLTGRFIYRPELLPSDECKKEAKEILKMLKSFGYVQLDPDQGLPEATPKEPRDSEYNYKYWAYGDICKVAQQDMLNEGFKKVRG